MGGEGRPKAWWPMEGSKAWWPIKGSKAWWLMEGSELGGQLKVPKLGGQWKGRKKHIFTSSHFPPKNFIETFNFLL
jgi:hypothetical protein